MSDVLLATHSNAIIKRLSAGPFLCFKPFPILEPSFITGPILTWQIECLIVACVNLITLLGLKKFIISYNVPLRMTLQALWKSVKTIRISALYSQALSNKFGTAKIRSIVDLLYLNPSWYSPIKWSICRETLPVKWLALHLQPNYTTL